MTIDIGAVPIRLPEEVTGVLDVAHGGTGVSSPVVTALEYRGTGSYITDVPAIQALVDNAPPEMTVINLIGDVQLGWGAVGSTPTPDYYSWYSTQDPVFTAIMLTRGNITIDGTRALITFAPPPYTNSGSNSTLIRPRWLGIGTMQNVQPRTISNVTVQNCSFQWPTGGGPIGHIIHLVGVGNVNIRNNKFFNATESAGVTLSRQLATDNVLVNWASHPTLALSVVSFSNGTENMEIGREYYAVNVDANSFIIRAFDDGADIQMERGETTVSAVAHLTACRGFGVWLDNCDDVFCIGNDMRYFQQGYFTNYCRNIHWQNETFTQFTEALDVQTVAQGGSVVGCRFLRAQNEGEALDLAGVQDWLCADNVFDSVKKCMGFYTKVLPPTYERFIEHGLANWVDFVAGNPGSVQMSAGDGPMRAGQRIWFEQRPDPSVSNQTLFPGETWNGGGYPNGDGDIQKYTVYIVDTVTTVLGVQSFTIKEQTYDADGNVVIPPTPTGAAIEFTTAGTANCYMHTIADDPTEIIACSDVLVTGNIGVNLVTTDLDADPNDPPMLGGIVMRVGTGRELRNGIDRSAASNGMLTQVSRIKILNNSFTGGRLIDIQECEELEIDNLWMTGFLNRTSTDCVEVLAMQQSIDTTPLASTQQGTLTGSARNIHIINSHTSGFTLLSPGEFTLENVEVRGYNLAGLAVPRPALINRMVTKTGFKKIGPITITDGRADVVGTLLNMSLIVPTLTPEATDSRISLTGPFILNAPSGHRASLCDFGEYMLEREQWFLPRSFTSSSVTDTRFYVFGPSPADRRLLVASLTTMVAMAATTSLKTTFTSATYNSGTGQITGLTAASGFYSNVQNRFLVSGATPSGYNGWKTAINASSNSTQLVWADADPGGPMTVMGEIHTVANHTQFRLLKIDSAGVQTSISSFAGIDNYLALAAFEEIPISWTTEPSNTAKEFGPTDTLVVEFRGVGAGSLVSDMMFNFNAMLISDTAA